MPKHPRFLIGAKRKIDSKTGQPSTVADKIRKAVIKNPNATSSELARALNTSIKFIQETKSRLRLLGMIPEQTTPKRPQALTQGQALIVAKNQRLIMWVAKQRLVRIKGKEVVRLRNIEVLSRDEIVSAGNIGLIKAAKKWTPEKGKFSTYAIPKIVKSLQVAISQKLRERRTVSLDRQSKYGETRAENLADTRIPLAVEKKRLSLRNALFQALDNAREKEHLSDTDILMVLDHFEIIEQSPSLRSLAEKYNLSHQGVLNRIKRILNLVKKHNPWLEEFIED